METSSQATSGGMGEYFRKLAEFSHNARMVLAYSAVTGLAFGVFRLLFNFYVLSLGGYTELFLGNLTSAQSAAGLLMALPAAYIAGRFSQKRIMVISGWASVLAFLGMVTLPGRLALIVFSFMEGMAVTVRQVAAAPFLMGNTSESERQYVFSFNFGLMTLAQFVGNQVGGYLPLWFSNLADVAPTSTLAYRLALGSMVLVSILAIGPLLGIRAKKEEADSASQMTFRAFLGEVWAHGGSLFKFVIPQIIIGLGAGLMMPFMNLYFRNVLGRSDATIGTLFGVGAFGMAIAQFVAPPLAGRLGKINTVILTQALSIPFLLTLGLTAYVVTVRAGSLNLTLWFWIAAAAYFFRLALMNLGGPVYTTFVLEQIDARVQSMAVSLNNIAFTFGWAIMPSVSGWLQASYDTLGFTIIFALVSGFYVLGIISERIFFRQAMHASRLRRKAERVETAPVR